MSLVQDARVLRDEFVPGEVVHRDGEVDHLSGVLGALEDPDRQAATTAILTGPSGAGKTCIARFVADRLREAVLDLDVVYCNCWANHTRFRALYTVLEDLGRAVDIHRQSTPRDELLARLRDHDRRCVLVLDEADQLADAGLLYDLHELPHVTLVLIANREAALFTDADARVRSRLAGREAIAFDRYDLAALVSILEDRVRWGLRDDAVDRSVLEHVADVAAGDARVAIGTLRTAARRAEREERDAITTALIDDAVSEARGAIRRKNLDVLTPHQRIVYDVVADAGAIDPSGIYEAYREAADDPRSERTVRSYLSKLERYDLVVADGRTRNRTYRVPESATD